LQVLTGHSEDVTCVVLTSRGRFAVTGSLDGTAQVWDMQAQDVSATDVHSGKVRLSGCCCPVFWAGAALMQGLLHLWRWLWMLRSLFQPLVHHLYWGGWMKMV
jgi:WD40 repeat protein